MAVTGILLGLFVIGHLIGNLLIFKGQDAFNSYADYLKGHPLLWVFRLGLLFVLVVHVYTSIRLYRENRAARGNRYVHKASVQATYGSRYMMLSGLVLFAFVIFHLLHLTVGVTDSAIFHATDAEGRPDVYAMVVDGFQRPLIVLAYVIAMLMLGSHLIHGSVSFFQTLGASHESYNITIKGLALAVVAMLVVGFCSIPVSIYFNYVPVAAQGVVP